MSDQPLSDFVRTLSDFLARERAAKTAVERAAIVRERAAFLASAGTRRTEPVDWARRAAGEKEE